MKTDQLAIALFFSDEFTATSNEIVGHIEKPIRHEPVTQRTKKLMRKDVMKGNPNQRLRLSANPQMRRSAKQRSLPILA